MSSRYEIPSGMEAAVDDWVDKGNGSYDDARRHFDLPVPDPAEVVDEIRESREDLFGKNVTKTVFCGDCGLELGRGDGCSHMWIGPRGGTYRSDGPRFLSMPKKRK